MTAKQSRFSFLTPSGARLTLDSAALPFEIETMASQIRFAGSSYSRGFQVGGPNYHDNLQRDVMHDAKLVGRLMTADRREVRVSRSEDEDTTIATLIGDHHEVMTVFPGPAPTNSRVLGVFDSVDIRDSAEGMTVRLRSGSMVSLFSETTVIICAGLADLSIAAASPSSLPKWRGSATQHGQLWRNANRPDRAGLSAARRADYLLAFPRALVELVPAPRGVPDDVLLDWTDGLRIDWQHAA
ncbi:MAG TPA: hypothetical protein VF612_09435 [Jatrophihabitans sp.]|jgi:hypothetical protein|uniref:hypothetical protein n=1 Tax=Jatrophihabitans sp. TaxID=1932789 RepID=UPI002EE25304